MQEVSLEQKIFELARPVASDVGVELLEVTLGGGARTPRVRVVVDRAGGVTTEELERVSRGVSLLLDVEDPLGGAYLLEVSSPGLDWPLTTEADFVRYEGSRLAVLTVDGEKIEGRNLGCVDGVLRLLVPGKGRRAPEKERMFDMRNVARVVRTVDWKDDRLRRSR